MGRYADPWSQLNTPRAWVQAHATRPRGTYASRLEGLAAGAYPHRSDLAGHGGGVAAVGMARYAEPNPHDRAFFAYDRALKRLALPGILIQVHMRMRGPVDVEGCGGRATCSSLANSQRSG